MKKTNSNSVIDFFLGWLFIYFICETLSNITIEDLLEAAFLIFFGHIVGFPMAMLTDEVRKSFDFFPGWIVKILRIVGIAELVGLVGLLIWFVFVY